MVAEAMRRRTQGATLGESVGERRLGVEGVGAQVALRIVVEDRVRRPGVADVGVQVDLHVEDDEVERRLGVADVGVQTDLHDDVEVIEVDSAAQAPTLAVGSCTETPVATRAVASTVIAPILSAMVEEEAPSLVVVPQESPVLGLASVGVAAYATPIIIETPPRAEEAP